jgi:8-oxo-dGTP pyrophosphatase MutT (NUDIX family)
MHPDDASSPDSPPRLPPPERFRTIWRVIREAHEEAGVLTDPADLAFSHVVDRRNPEGQPRIGFFFTATRWQGEPVNREPHKCAGLHWADPARPVRNGAWRNAAVRRIRGANTRRSVAAGAHLW